MNRGEDGFTITELLIVIILTTLFTMIVMMFAFDLWRTGYTEEASNDTLVTRLTANDILRDEIGTSSGLIIQNSLADDHVGVGDPSDGTGKYWLAIHAVPGNKPIGASGTITPLIYFRRFSQDASKNYVMNGIQPYEDEYILYMDGSTKSLMQRTLANRDAAGNNLKTSCPSSVASPSCPADKTIAPDISSVSMRYFSRTGNLIDYTSITDPSTGNYIGPDFTAVEVVELTLNLSKKPTYSGTNTTQSSTIIRIALRNS